MCVRLNARMARNAARREEFADRGEAPDLDAENVLAAGEEIADVFRRHDARSRKASSTWP